LYWEVAPHRVKPNRVVKKRRRRKRAYKTFFFLFGGEKGVGFTFSVSYEKEERRKKKDERRKKKDERRKKKEERRKYMYILLNILTTNTGMPTIAFFFLHNCV